MRPTLIVLSALLLTAPLVALAAPTASACPGGAAACFGECHIDREGEEAGRIILPDGTSYPVYLPGRPECAW